MNDYNTSRHVKTEVSGSDTKKKIDTEYFYRVSIFQYIAVIIGMGMLGFIAYHPSPENYLERIGGPGQRLLYLRSTYSIPLKIGFFVSILLHIGEAIYVVKVAANLNLTQETIQKWVIQTVIVGYASLQHLLKYRDSIVEVKQK